MPTLNCSVTNCAYNSSQHCCLAEIDVTGVVSASTTEETFCASFIQRAEGETSNASNQCYADPHTNIHCEADSCMYNMGHNCTADAIEVAGQGASNRDQTECTTFSDGSDAFNESLKF